LHWSRRCVSSVCHFIARLRSGSRRENLRRGWWHWSRRCWHRRRSRSSVCWDRWGATASRCLLSWLRCDVLYIRYLVRWMSAGHRVRGLVFLFDGKRAVFRLWAFDGCHARHTKPKHRHTLLGHAVLFGVFGFLLSGRLLLWWFWWKTAHGHRTAKHGYAAHAATQSPHALT
jgi:hypothetical protein